ncbi:MAG TPA: alpha-glucosidase [Acidobacteriaceae bacterium]
MRRFLSLAALCLLFAASASPVNCQVAKETLLNGATTPDALAAAPSMDQTWWKHALIYEIYPRSFQDSDGDGVGDLNGITSRMGYLQGLGVDAIWIAPMYPSPQVDFGYDISNYESVDPQYGTVADMDRLVAEGKKRNIRVVLDMVLNHTSDKHQWFIESAASRTGAKADWYVWNNGVPENSPGVTDYQKRFAHDGMVPPNNWVSLFGGSAWEWVPARKQFYYHKFYKQQPDLDWRNPAVEKAMFDAMRFWLDHGVAGFRLDAIPTLFEDPKLRSEPEKGGINAQGDPNLDTIYTDNLPEVHDVIRRMRAMANKYPGNRVLIGETYLPNTVELDKWYGGPAHDELQLPMDMLVGFGGATFNAANFRRYISEVETEVHGGQPLLVFDNHDNVRSIDRFGDGTHNMEIAKAIATLLLTTRATALTYYGAEIGMPTTEPRRREDVKDPIGITGWPQEKGRDGERTPMQWIAGPVAGFSTNPNTWLPIPPSYKTINVDTESADPNSLLNWNKKLIELRRSNPALHNGGIVMLNKDSKDVLSYIRTAPKGAAAVVVAINMSSQPQTIALDLAGTGIKGTAVKTIAATDPSLMSTTGLGAVSLPPFSSWIAEVR